MLAKCLIIQIFFYCVWCSIKVLKEFNFYMHSSKLIELIAIKLQFFIVKLNFFYAPQQQRLLPLLVAIITDFTSLWFTTSILIFILWSLQVVLHSTVCIQLLAFSNFSSKNCLQKKYKNWNVFWCVNKKLYCDSLVVAVIICDQFVSLAGGRYFITNWHFYNESISRTWEWWSKKR